MSKTKCTPFLFFLITILSVISFALILMGSDEMEPSPYDRLMEKASDTGSVRIIVKLDVPDIKILTENSKQYKTVIPGEQFRFGGIQADLDLETAIHSTADSVLLELNGKDYTLNHKFDTLPYLALDVSPEALAILPTLPEVLMIYEDSPRKLVMPEKSTEADKPMLDGTVGIIGADNAWAQGYTGSGWYVAILDTGIRRTHQFFQGKTIVEACFSEGADCPNNQKEMYGTGAAAHYASTYYGFDHGTHVAGIAAGNYGTLAGVAKNSNIIAVQVFTPFPSSSPYCDGTACVLSYDSDVVKALEYIYSLRGTYSISSVNLSLGSGAYSSSCDSEPHKEAIDNLKSVRIATAIATGNDGYCGYISSPACISSAVSVGASNNYDVETYFNNWHRTMQDLFAPGSSIYSSTGDSNSSYESWSGTSMATPHVTGTWALLRQAAPTASVDTILTALQSTGYEIDSLCSGSDTCPRIQVDDALDTLEASSTITVTSPNGGESWEAGTSHTIKWTSTGTVGNVKISYSTNNGTNWTTVTSSTSNDGAYTWSVPDNPSTQCKVKIQEASDGSPSDTSNAVFSITAAGSVTPKITVSSPNGGENWEVGSKHTVKWTTEGTVGDVKISYSINNGTNWTTVASSTSNDGAYTWTIPNKESTQCKIKIQEASDGSPSDTSNAVFAITSPEPPELSLSRTSFNFGGITGGVATSAQSLLIDNTGGGSMPWTASSSTTWLICTPSSGTGPGVVDISVSTTGLGVGTYTGMITITAPDADNSPRTASITLNIMNAGSNAAPIGTLSTPINGTAVYGSVPVTGWVIDDIEVTSVEIYRGTGNQAVYLGNAVMVEGARPDIEAAYPGYPLNYKAGWGYMLLTYFLPNGGNGSYTLSAIARDKTGKTVSLGQTTVTCSNSTSSKPFGAIDTPVAGGEASGSNYRNGGWVLTPLPNQIPVSGSTISVYVDGKYLGTPEYNIYRADIASYFPGYANSSGAHGYFDFDTTAYDNGLHTIFWTVVDNAGNAEGIGSRYFSILNTSQNRAQSSRTYTYKRQISGIPVNRTSPVSMVKGTGTLSEPETVFPDGTGRISFTIKELERIEIHFTPGTQPLKTLPVGSTMDSETGIFYWQPGPGFVGPYDLEFVDTVEKKLMKVNVLIENAFGTPDAAH